MDKTIKLACLLAIIIFSSCASRKDFVYLQDMDELQEYPMVQKYEAIIHRDDRLSIIVNSKNPELSLPFNMSGSRSYSVEADGSNPIEPLMTDPSSVRISPKVFSVTITSKNLGS